MSEFELLKTAFNNKRLTHFYIFSGEKSEIKLKTALNFMALFYENQIDKDNILKLNHLNLSYVRAEGKYIVKDQIYDLLEEFIKTSLVEGPRFFIIEDGEKLNIKSSNSLLKFLEEPPKDVYGIIMTDNILLLPITITSRAQIINFKGITKEEIRTKLKTKYAQLISNYTKVLDEAILLENNCNFISKISFVVELLKNRCLSKNNMYLYYIENKIMNFDDFIIIKKLLCLYFLDILKYINNNFDLAFNFEEETIKKLSNIYSILEIYKILEVLEEIEMKANFNLKIESVMNKIILDM